MKVQFVVSRGNCLIRRCGRLDSVELFCSFLCSVSKHIIVCSCVCSLTHSSEAFGLVLVGKVFLWLENTIRRWQVQLRFIGKQNETRKRRMDQCRGSIQAVLHSRPNASWGLDKNTLENIKYKVDRYIFRYFFCVHGNGGNNGKW